MVGDKRLKKNQLGFTIVELLIVIVVIGVLAAITIVAYNGIQDRALNTARNQAASQLQTLVKSYHAVNDEYPPLSYDAGVMSETMVSCVGSGWPTLEGRQVCWNVYNEDQFASASTFYVQDNFHEALRSIGTVPDFPKQYVGSLVDSNGRQVDLSALIFAYRETPSSVFPGGHFMAWMLKGGVEDVQCQVDGAIQTSVRDDISRCVVPFHDAVF